MKQGAKLSRKPAEAEKVTLVCLIDHPVFDGTCAMMIVLNSVFIGLGIVWDTDHDVTNRAYEMVGHACTGFFAVELALRIAGRGCRAFFCRGDSWGPRGWNLFDTLLVFI